MIEKLYVYCSSGTEPYRNIATEKYLLESVPKNSCILYLWQNENTVVIGRNQNAWAECRTSLLEAEGGRLARRLSGGGAVFHDLGNLNFTFLVEEENYNLDRQLQVIRTACEAFGITVERSGRNDLLAEGQKFSGNAFYHCQGKAYHHGTLLVSANIDKLSRYLTPAKAKLQAKGVSSVRSRVVNLQTLCPSLTCSELNGQMQKAFEKVYGISSEPITLTPEAQQKISQYEKELSCWDWLYGPKLPLSFTCEDRFSWGSIELQMEVSQGIVQRVQVYSDAMDWTLPDTLEQCLKNCRFTLCSLCTGVQNAITDNQVASDICQMLKMQDI